MNVSHLATQMMLFVVANIISMRKLLSPGSTIHPNWTPRFIHQPYRLRVDRDFFGLFAGLVLYHQHRLSALRKIACVDSASFYVSKLG